MRKDVDLGSPSPSAISCSVSRGAAAEKQSKTANARVMVRIGRLVPRFRCVELHASARGPELNHAHSALTGNPPMITVTRLGKHCGAEISGVDLSKELDSDTFGQVANAFFDNEVAVFRNQKITPAQQVAFTRRFGTLEVHVRKESRLEGHPEILIVSNVLDENGKAIGAQDAGRFWHSDLSYKKEPSMLSALYALEVPVKDGRVLGDTGFASTTAAYEALSDEMKQRIAGLKNVH